MKKLHLIIIVLSMFASTNVVFAQAKKPTLMILPSDNWCEQRYFMTEFDNQGTKQKVPNYKQAFQEDTELGQVISKIGSLMIDRGFPLKDVEQELKAIEARNAEDNMTTSTASGSSISESPLDKLKNIGGLAAQYAPAAARIGGGMAMAAYPGALNTGEDKELAFQQQVAAQMKQMPKELQDKYWASSTGAKANVMAAIKSGVPVLQALKQLR